MESSPLDLLLSEEQALVLAAVSEFARDYVAPRHEAIDHAGVHPEELWSELAGLGLFGTIVPEDRGGAGAGFRAHVAAVEALARAGGVAAALLVAQELVVDALLLSGEEEAMAAWLDGLAGGEVLGSPALQEDDPRRLQCRASGDGRSVRLTGVKSCVPFPGRAGVFLVRAQGAAEEVLALVAGDAEGVRHRGPEVTLGLSGLEMGPLVLEEAPGRVLGGAELGRTLRADARMAVGALLCGLARGALQHARDYAGVRRQFGRLLREFGAVQERLSRSEVRCEGAWALVLAAALMRDRGRPHLEAARRARVLAAEVAPLACDDALQVYGGLGYSREYPVERFYRDVRFPGFGEYDPAQIHAESEAKPA